MGGQGVAEQSPGTTVAHGPLQAVAIGVDREGAQRRHQVVRPPLAECHRYHQLGVGGEELQFEVTPGPADSSGDPPGAGVELGVVLGPPQRHLDHVGHIGRWLVPDGHGGVGDDGIHDELLLGQARDQLMGPRAHAARHIGVGALGGEQDVDVAPGAAARVVSDGANCRWGRAGMGSHGPVSGHVARRPGMPEPPEPTAATGGSGGHIECRIARGRNRWRTRR